MPENWKDLPNITVDLADTQDVTGVLPIANGGTNSSAALSNNRIIRSTSGGLVEAAAITASRVLLSDSNGIPTHSGMTSAEFATVAKWTKYSSTFAALSAANTTNNIELFSLPAKTLITRVVIKHGLAFTGGLISAYTLRVGTVATPNKYIAAFDVFQAASDTIFSVSVVNDDMEHFTAATSIRLTGVSTGANLDQATAGTVDIYVQTTLLP